MAEVARIELDTSEMQRYAQFLRQAPRIAREEMAASVLEAIQFLGREVKERTPTRTGTLRASIFSQMHGEAISIGTGVAGIVGTPLNYAIPVELGTKEHDIVAKNVRALSFIMGGKRVAFKKVHHPGTKGAHMFQRAFNETEPEVQRIIIAAIPRIVARLEAGER